MPDGYGNDMPSWAIDLLNRPRPSEEPKSWPDTRQAMVAVARLCRALGMNKQQTLHIMNMTRSNDNYHWLNAAWGES